MVHDFPSAKIDFNSLVDRLKARKYGCVLSPEQWRDADLEPLEWEEVKFEDQSQALIPRERGVYAFIVRHINAFFPPNHGYIMYIGETGNISPNRHLRARFREYLKEGEKFQKRPKVYEMLSVFKEDLTFAYAIVPDAAVNTEKIEETLCDALLPWAVSDDFSAEVRAAMKAVWS